MSVLEIYLFLNISEEKFDKHSCYGTGKQNIICSPDDTVQTYIPLDVIKYRIYKPRYRSPSQVNAPIPVHKQA